MKCPEPNIKEPCYFCYNGECFATHWWECAAIIKDFNREITFEVDNNAVFVVGKGNFNFFLTQSGF